MIISKTPLRCSFFGGGTDFHSYYENSKHGHGSVLSTALDLHVYITVNKNFDNKIRLCYAGNELVDHIDQVKHNIIREAMKLTGVTSSVEIVYSADIPLSGAGIGLASSSALAVGVLHALHAYKGEFVSPQQLAQEACHIEIDLLGQQIGIQDQYAVAFGGIHKYRFFPDRVATVTPLLWDKEGKSRLESHCMLFYTGQTRDSRKILQEQSATLEEKMEMLDRLVEQVDRAYDLVTAGDVLQLGEMLHQGWQVKKRFAGGVSNPEIDKMYQDAQCAGMLGGKILGAGGGGFLLAFVPPDRQKAVETALKGYRRMSFSLDPQGSRIIFVD